MTRIALLPLFALAACAAPGDSASAPAGRDPSAGSAQCPLTVRFASYAMGIDRGALQAVEARLADDPAVQGVERRQWGREGELDLCVRTRTDADAERLQRAIAAAFPADPRGPLSVSTRTGLVAHAPPR